MAAHPAGGPALAGVLVQRGDLHAGGPGARQGARAARHGDHHGGGVASRRPGRRARGGASVRRAEPHDGRASGQPYAGHAAGRPALRPDRGGRVPQQLGVRRDEHQLVRLAGQLHRADHPVPGLQRDQLELVPVLRVVGQHPLDHALRGPQRQAARTAGQAIHSGEPDHRLTPVEGRELRHRRTPGQRHGAGPGRHRGQLEHVELDQPPGGGHQPHGAPHGGTRRGDDHVVGGA